MLGRDHAISGAVAFAALAPLAVPLKLPQLAAGAILTAGAALLPDWDEPGSTIAREAGFLGRGFARTVRFIAGGHRRGTHTLIGLLVFTVLALAAAGCSHVSLRGGWPALALTVTARLWLVSWLALMITAALHVIPRRGHRHGHLRDIAGVSAAAGLWFWHAGLMMVPACIALGVITHIAGDEATHDGVPFLWPFFGHKFHDLPVTFRTGGAVETRVVSPLLITALIAALAWDTGIITWLAVHTSGHLAGLTANPAGGREQWPPAYRSAR